MRTECALFPLQSRVAACVLTKDNQDERYQIDNEAQMRMARLGEVIVHSWPRRLRHRPVREQSFVQCPGTRYAVSSWHAGRDTRREGPVSALGGGDRHEACRCADG